MRASRRGGTAPRFDAAIASKDQPAAVARELGENGPRRARHLDGPGSDRRHPSHKFERPGEFPQHA